MSRIMDKIKEKDNKELLVLILRLAQAQKKEQKAQAVTRVS